MAFFVRLLFFPAAIMGMVHCCNNCNTTHLMGKRAVKAHTYSQYSSDVFDSLSRTMRHQHHTSFAWISFFPLRSFITSCILILSVCWCFCCYLHRHTDTHTLEALLIRPDLDFCLICLDAFVETIHPPLPFLICSSKRLHRLIPFASNCMHRIWTILNLKYWNCLSLGTFASRTQTIIFDAPII